MLNQKEVKSLLKSYMQIEKEADSIKQKHQRLAKKIPNIGPRPKSAKKQPEVAVRNEITQLKQRRLQLEQESSKLSNEFDYMKKIIQSDLKQQLGNQNQREQEILNNLDQVVNETKINYERFRLGKFLSKINSIFAANQQHYLNECYYKLKTAYISSNSLQQKFIQFRQFSLQKKCLAAWKEQVYQIIEEKKQKQNEMQSRYQMEQNQLALEFRNFFLKNRTFKIWIKFVSTSRLTKHFDQNQTNMKVKVNQFLSEMQQQIAQQISKEKKEIEELKQSYVSDEEIKDQIQEDYSVSISDESLLELTEEQAQLIIKPTELQPIPIQNQQQQQQQEYEQQVDYQQSQEKQGQNQKQKQKSKQNILSPPPLPPKQVHNPWKQNNVAENELPEDLIKIIEENRQSIEISHNRPSVASLQSNDTRKQQSSVERKNIIAKELDEKAKKRKEMNETIKRKHEEKRQQQELQKQQQEEQRQLEIKKRKEEEYKRLQDKKKLEQEQLLKQQQQKFEAEYKMDLATRHYERSLQKYQIFIPIVKNWLKLNEKEQKANDFFQKILKLRLLNMLKLNYQLTQEEREQEETIKINIANSYYKIRLSKKVIRCLNEQVKIMENREKEAMNVRRQFLVRRIMTGWYIELPDLRAENLKLERISGRLVNDFRKANLLKRFFQEWRTCVQEQIGERNRVQHKEEMWSKVNQWLQEFDQENS